MKRGDEDVATQRWNDCEKNNFIGKTKLKIMLTAETNPLKDHTRMFVVAELLKNLS